MDSLAMSATTQQKTILAAIDGSINSYLAAGYAALLAKQLNAHLGLVHVLDVPPLSFWAGIEGRMKADIRAEAERTLTDISNRIRETCEITPEYYLVEGIPDEEILKVVSASPEIAMVVVGRRGIAHEKRSHPSLGRAWGRVPVRLAEVLPIPVVVVPPDISASGICPALAEFNQPI
jgi:nucleotide-binding universal stress UspA family protein